MPLRFRMKPKRGKHYMRLDGKKMVLRPGDVVTCEPGDLGGAIDKFEQLDPTPPPPEPEVGLRVVDRGDGTFDVVNEATDRPVNDVPLSEDDAYSTAGLAKPTGLSDRFEEDAKDGEEQPDAAEA